MKEVAIVNYGAGNLGSLINAIEFLNYKVIILDKPKTNRFFSHIILPGVGAFGTLAKNLVKLKFKDYLIEHKERQKKSLSYFKKILNSYSVASLLHSHYRFAIIF